MAGYTNFKILIGGDAVDGAVLDQLIAAHGHRTHAPDESLVGPGTWRLVYLEDANQRHFDEKAQPLLDAAAALGAYWRVAQEGHDDFDESWFDSTGRHVYYEPFGDIRYGGHRAEVAPLYLTEEQAQHVAVCVDYRGYNAIEQDPAVAEDEADVNEAVIHLVARHLKANA